MYRVRNFRFNLQRLALVPLAAVLIGLSAGPVSAAGGPITFRAYIGDDCINIEFDPVPTIALSWKASNGRVKANTNIAGESGYAYYCSTSEHVEVGDRLRASDGVTVHKLVIPALSINVNRVKDLLKGTGPAGSIVHLSCGGGPFPMFEPCIWKARVRVNSEGRWSYRLRWDVIGGDHYYALWKSPNNDRVWTTGIAPFLDFSLGKATFSGAFRPNGVAHVVIRDGTTFDPLAMGTAVGDPLDGSISGRLRDTSGNPYLLRPGDLVSSDISADVDWQVPDIEATITAATDYVEGYCHEPDPSLITVWVRKSAGLRGPAIVGLEPDGHFGFNINDELWSGSVNIKAGDRILLACMRGQADWVRTKTVAQ